MEYFLASMELLIFIYREELRSLSAGNVPALICMPFSATKADSVNAHNSHIPSPKLNGSQFNALHDDLADSEDGLSVHVCLDKFPPSISMQLHCNISSRLP